MNRTVILCSEKKAREFPRKFLWRMRSAAYGFPWETDIRSLNLGNSAAIILYEALRQNGFPDLQETGNLHRLKWTDIRE